MAPARSASAVPCRFRRRPGSPNNMKLRPLGANCCWFLASDRDHRLPWPIRSCCVHCRASDQRNWNPKGAWRSHPRHRAAARLAVQPTGHSSKCDCLADRLVANARLAEHVDVRIPLGVRAFHCVAAAIALGIAIATVIGQRRQGRSRQSDPRSQVRVAMTNRSGSFRSHFQKALTQIERKWRPEPESNRRARICSPLRNHSAIGPGEASAFPRASLAVKPRRFALGLSMNGGWPARALPDMRRSSLNSRCIIGI